MGHGKINHLITISHLMDPSTMISTWAVTGKIPDFTQSKKVTWFLLPHQHYKVVKGMLIFKTYQLVPQSKWWISAPGKYPQVEIIGSQEQWLPWGLLVHTHSEGWGQITPTFTYKNLFQHAIACLTFTNMLQGGTGAHQAWLSWPTSCFETTQFLTKLLKAAHIARMSILETMVL